MTEPQNQGLTKHCCIFASQAFILRVPIFTYLAGQPDRLRSADAECGLPSRCRACVPPEFDIRTKNRSCLSFPSRQETRSRRWIPACAGMTEPQNQVLTMSEAHSRLDPFPYIFLEPAAGYGLKFGNLCRRHFRAFPKAVTRRSL
jgi:hypothetical protein